MIKIFLSSDSKENIIRLSKLFPNNIFYHESPSYDRNDNEAIKNAVIDLFCLSKTNKIYGSYCSSFSEVAAEMGQIEYNAVF